MEEDGRPVSQAQGSTRTNFWLKPWHAAQCFRWNQALETVVSDLSRVCLSGDEAWVRLFQKQLHTVFIWNRESIAPQTPTLPIFSNGIKGRDSTPGPLLCKHNYQGTQGKLLKKLNQPKPMVSKDKQKWTYKSWWLPIQRHSMLGQASGWDFQARLVQSLPGSGTSQSVLSSAPVPAPYYRCTGSSFRNLNHRRLEPEIKLLGMN